MNDPHPSPAAVTEPISAGRQSLALGLATAVILFFLFFQAIVTFRVVCPPMSITQLSSFRILCAPALFPFLDYPMYKEPHYKGEKIQDVHLYGVLDDSTEVEILPEDLRMNLWMFQLFLFAIDQDNIEEINFYTNLYEEMHKADLVGLRLENHPYVLADEGLVQGAPEVIKVYSLPDD
jgi:hypothetical protein